MSSINSKRRVHGGLLFGTLVTAAAMVLAACGSSTAGSGGASSPGGSSQGGSSQGASSPGGSSAEASTGHEPLHLKMAALPNISDGALALGKSKGWYADNNLDITYLQFDNGHGAQAVQSLASGSIDLAGVGSTPALLGAATGAIPLKIISLINDPTKTFKLYSTSKITSLQDLKGKKVAFAKGSVWEYFVRKLLATEGMTIDDIQPVDLGAADGVTAFVAGHVDAAIAPPALVKNIETQMPKAHLLFDASTDFGPDSTFGIVNPIVVTEKTFEAKKTALHDFLSVYHGKVVPYLEGADTHAEAVKGIVSYIDSATGGHTDLKTIDNTIAQQTFYNTQQMKSYMSSDKLKKVLKSQVQFLKQSGAMKSDESVDLDKLVDGSLL